MEFGDEHNKDSHVVPMPGGTVKGMPIAVKGLTYTVVSNKDKKVKIALLKNVCAAFEPGKMSALMGASGSGKTTLLDVLAGRKTTGETTGTILYSAQKASQNFLRRYTGYVEQTDTLLHTLTVREMLMYTAELKRPHTESFAEKQQAVDYFIKRLALEGCQDTKIGNALVRGISGGQAKRTSIAMSMVTRPRVLFLDEPTSGLDSYTANETMLLVKDLATREGVTIVATIHSPSPYTFELFDSLTMLLSGEVVYFGKNDESMLEYFKGGCGIVPKTSMTDAKNIHNPAEFLTDLIVGATQRQQGQEYAEAYRNSDVKRRGDAIIEGLQTLDSMRMSAETKTALETKRGTVTPFWWGLKIFFKYRTAKNYLDPDFLGARLGDKVIFSLLIMALYWGAGSDYSPANLNNINALLFMWTVLPAYGAAGYVPSLVLERPLFLRERSDGLYKTITYLVAKVLEELILAVFISVAFAALVFYPLELHGSFAVYWLIYLEVLGIGILLAYLVAALSPNLEVANTALPAFVTCLLFFAGLLLRFPDMPVYLAWFSYLNFMRFSWSGLMRNEFGDNPPLFQGDQTVLQVFDVADVNESEQMAYLLVFFVGFFVLTYFALAFKKYSAR